MPTTSPTSTAPATTPSTMSGSTARSLQLAVMNQWFGEPWPRGDHRADVCSDDRFRIPTPVGKPCMNCGEEILDGDRGIAFPGAIMGPSIHVDPTPLYMHLECQLRT